jgi:nitrite reductase (NADH) small subunit
VFRTRTGKVFAVANECPHRGGPLADGMLAGEQVVCPMHAFRYDAGSGACDQSGVCAVATYAVEVTADGLVRVGVPVA